MLILIINKIQLSPPSVNVVNIGGDYEIGRFVRRSFYASVVR